MTWLWRSSGGGRTRGTMEHWLGRKLGGMGFGVGGHTGVVRSLIHDRPDQTVHTRVFLVVVCFVVSSCVQLTECIPNHFRVAVSFSGDISHVLTSARGCGRATELSHSDVLMIVSAPFSHNFSTSASCVSFDPPPLTENVTPLSLVRGISSNTNETVFSSLVISKSNPFRQLVSQGA